MTSSTKSKQSVQDPIKPRAALDTRAVAPISEGDFKTIVENSPDIVCRVDRQGRYLYVNHAIERAFGFKAADFIGKTGRELGFPDAVAEGYARATAAAVKTGGSRTFEFSLPVQGRTEHFTARATPEFDAEGAVASVLIVTYDVTQRTEAQLERDALLVREQASRMQAEAAARARDEFLAIVSHELRSPLNGIQSWTHVLEAYVPMDQPLVVRALSGIKLGVQQQVRLIEDLLDATLIMSGKLRLTRGVVELGSSVDAAMRSLALEAEEKQLQFTKVMPAGLPVIEGDAKRIEQVIWNLLSNAVKFTPEKGHVSIEVSLVGNEVLMLVRDNGRGISAEFLPYLFDPFRQADESSTRRAGGIGLGLTLVRRLTELHGGRVCADSGGENCGSTFSVYLPLGSKDLVRPEESTVRRYGQKTLGSLRGMRVALVDDLKEARDSLAQLLEQAGATVVSFSSGKAVVKHLRHLQPNDRPHVLICDIAMPEQDGYRTLQQIRQDESRRDLQPMPAIALTAFSQQQDQSKALASGFQMHMAKPIEPAELIAILAALTAPENRAGEPR